VPSQPFLGCRRPANRAAAVDLAFGRNRRRRIVVIIPSACERYLSSWLFADINVESDSIDDLIRAS
jgi:cysteine synthase A